MRRRAEELEEREDQAKAQVNEAVRRVNSQKQTLLTAELLRKINYGDMDVAHRILTGFPLVGTMTEVATFERRQPDDVLTGADTIWLARTASASRADLIQQVKDAAVDHAVSSGQDWWNQRFGCAPAHPGGWIICCASTCSGDFSVYRFSFTLCLFFASLALLTVGKSRIGATAHRGFWLIKAFVLMSLLVSTLFIENDTLVGYRETARYRRRLARQPVLRLSVQRLALVL